MRDIATGISYMALGDRDGNVYVLGVVPDDATQVSINGTTVEVKSNLWFYAGKASDPSLAFTVSSADGSKKATLGG
jgi:hypothetical protein